MLDLLKKGLLTGIGLGLTTKEKVEEYDKKEAKEAKRSQEEGEKLLGIGEIIAVWDLEAGSHTIILTVIDDDGSSDFDEVIINISEP